MHSVTVLNTININITQYCKTYVLIIVVDLWYNFKLTKDTSCFPPWQAVGYALWAFWKKSWEDLTVLKPWCQIFASIECCLIVSWAWGAGKLIFWDHIWLFTFAGMTTPLKISTEKQKYVHIKKKDCCEYIVCCLINTCEKIVWQMTSLPYITGCLLKAILGPGYIEDLSLTFSVSYMP